MGVHNQPGEKRVHPGEKRARRMWVSLVVLLLGLQVVIGGVAVYLATGDPSVSVVPDYHHAALNWDAVRRADGAAARQGWTIQVKALEVVDAEGRRAVEVRLSDRLGQPIDGLEMTGTLYHHARAGDVQEISLPSAGGGRYLTTVEMNRPGLWQVVLAIEGGEEPMRSSTTVEL